MALVLPPAMGSWSNLWRIVLASFMAIVVAKGFFGGIGANVFNPALIGRAFLVVSFPTQMTTWTMPFLANKVDAVSSATLLTQIKGGTLPAQTISNFKDYFFGLRAGCIGETAIFLILIALIFLLCTKTIDWRAPVGMVCTALTGTIIASAVTGSNIGQDILLTLLTGGLLFGATFMVTDYATTPVTKKGRLIFGIGCGLITFLIRQFSGYPEGVMFSILIMNSTVSFLNRLIGKKYGFVKKPKGGK
jgi:electron transport complex protein RnfD